MKKNIGGRFLPFNSPGKVTPDALYIIVNSKATSEQVT